jgi:hypothetical protein
MRAVLIDSNIILDVLEDDPNWADWSESTLERYSNSHQLCINEIVYSEVSIGFARIEDLESAMARAGFGILQIPKEALFLAGKIYLKYKANKGRKVSPLPDFYIGAHAAVFNLKLMTRDRSRYRTYFPTVELICPNEH